MPYPDEELRTEEPTNSYDRLVAGLSPAAPVEPPKAPVQETPKPALADEMVVTKAPLGVPVGKVAPTPEKPPEPFGQGRNLYDMESATAAGLKPDATGHWASRVPTGEKEGLLLKHEKHPTFYKTLQGEAEVGNRIFRSPEGRLYSFGPDKVLPEGYEPYISTPKPQEGDYDRFVKGQLPTTPVMGQGEFDPNTLPPEARKLYDARKVSPDDSMAWRGLKHGMAGLGEAAGTLTRAAGHALGVPELKKLGGAGEEYFGEMAKNWEPPKEISGAIWDSPGLLKNSSWWAYSVADMVPSLAAAIGAAYGGGAVAAGAGVRMALSPAAIRRAAMLGASLSGGAAGGSLEGASTYKEVLERTGDEDTALRAGVMMGFASAGLNAISLHKMMAPGMREALKNFVAKGDVAGLRQLAKHMAASGATEATTEYLEEPAEALIKQFMAPGKYTEEEFWEQLKQGLNVMPPSFLMGGVGAIGGAKAAGAIEKKTGTQENVELVQPPAQPLGNPVPTQQNLPGTEAPVQTPPPAAPTAPVETPAPTAVAPVETPAPVEAPVETPVPPVGTPPPVTTPAGTTIPTVEDYLAGVQNIEEMSFDDLVKHVQQQYSQQQAATTAAPTEEVPPAAAAGGVVGEPARPAPPLGTPAAIMSEVASPMVTSPETDVEKEGEVGKLFGEAGELSPLERRFLYENDLKEEEVRGWDTRKLEDLQFEFDDWQKADAETAPALPAGDAWNAFMTDYTSPGMTPEASQKNFEEEYWPSLGNEAKGWILDEFRAWAEERGLELPATMGQTAAAVETPTAQATEAAQLPPEILNQLKVAHRAAIEKAANEGRMTVEQARQLGHFDAHDDLFIPAAWGGAPAPAPTGSARNVPVSWEDFAAENLPKLQQSITDAHAALTDTQALLKSQHYDRSFPIPKEGGILMARQSELYRTDPDYREKVESVIQDIASAMVQAHKQMNLLRGVHVGGGFGIMYEGDVGTGMTATGVTAGYALSPDDLSLAWYLMGADKYSAHYKGDVSIREALQNSLDAVLSALKKKAVHQGEININAEWDSYSVEDNGIGMDAETIRDKFLGLFGSTKRDQSGRFGKFGIAKAIILKPTKQATWTIETREFYFDNTGAESNAPIMRVAPGDERLGTRISVKGGEYIISEDGRRFVETTEVPKNVTLRYNSMEVKSPFADLKGRKFGNIKVDDETTLRITYYKDAPNEYDNKVILRLHDKQTGAKLTQNIKQAVYTWGNREPLRGALIVDVETKATVGKEGSQYPFKDSRDELKQFAWEHVERIIQQLAKKDPPPPPPKRKETTLGKRAEFRQALSRIATDPDYQDLIAYLDELGIKRTPLEEFPITVETTFSGKKSGSMLSIKQLVAFEAVVQITAKALGSSGQILTNVSQYDNPFMVYGVLGDSMKAEYDRGNNTIGFNYMFTTPEMLTDPHRMAHHLKARADHELAHHLTPAKADDPDGHGQEYNANLSLVLDVAAPVFDQILTVAEMALGKTAHNIRTAVASVRNQTPQGVDPKSLSISDLLGILKTMGYNDQTNPAPVSMGQLEMWKEVEEANHANVELFQPLSGPSEAKQTHLFAAELEGSHRRAGGEREAEGVGGEPQHAMGEGNVGGRQGRLLPGAGVAEGGAAQRTVPGLPAARSAGAGGPIGEPARAGATASGPVRAQKEVVPTFYSQMQKHLEKSLPGKGKGKELASLVEGWAKKGGFKEAELKWTGLVPWLREQEGTVTKQQVLDYVAQNNADFEEITRTPDGVDIDDINLRERNREYIEQEPELEYVVTDQETGEELYTTFDEEDADAFLAAAEREAEARGEEPDIGIEERYREPYYDEYSEVEVDLETDEGDLYVVRGSDASGYWEIVDTPDGVNAPRQGYHSWEGLEDAIKALETERAKELGLQSKYDQYVLRGGDEYKEFQMVLKARPAELQQVRPGVPVPAKYRSSHWEEEDVVVHMRVTTRTDANGNRTLMVEEIQGDWPQDYRKDQNERKRIEAERTKLMQRAEELAASVNLTVPQFFKEANRTDSHGYKLPVTGGLQVEGRRIMTRLHELMAEQQKIGNEPRIKEPPMAKTWHELAMKRLLRYAAENGYDAIAWTTGQQQIDRYDLSQHVDQVNYAPHLDGGRLTASKNGEMKFEETNIPPEKLERYLGKEASKKLLESTSGEEIDGQPIYRLEGEELKLGGEGMKGFYDEMLPAFMRKYGKQWGAMVADTVINTEGPNAHLTEFRAVPNRNVTYPFETEKGWAIHDARTNSDWGFFPTVREAIDKFEEAHQGQTVANPLYMVEAWSTTDNKWVPMMGAQSGVRLEEAQEYAANQYERMKLNNATVHSMTLTPEMKESVLYNGQALWQLGGWASNEVNTEVLQERIGKYGVVEEQADPGSKYNRSWGIKFQNGKVLFIGETKTGEIELRAGSEESLAQWRELGVTEGTTTGLFRPMNIGGVIEFAKGQGLRTVDHELWHFIKHWLLTPEERAMLDKTYGGNEEAEAEAYAKWKPEFKNAIFQKIFEFARMVVRALTGAKTPEDLFAMARSGKLYGRAAVENVGTQARAQQQSDRETIDSYREGKVAPAPKPNTWRDTLNDFRDLQTIRERVIPALAKFWEKTYTEIWAEHFPIEKLAKAAKEKVIVGIPRKVGEILDWALAAHRGSTGFANQALVGDKEGGVFLPKMEAGYETTETVALQEEIQELLVESEGRVTSKIRRRMEKLQAKLEEAYTTGDVEKVHDSLAVVCEPLRELAARRGWDVDRVFNDLFQAKMVAERDLELFGELGDRMKTIEKGVDPDAARQVLEALEREYGADYETLENVAKNVRAWADSAIIEPLVRSGRLSREVAAQIREANKYYVPFFRLMEEMENKGFMGPGESVFEVRKIPIKEIKGSERKIIDPLSMFTSLVYNVADAAGRAHVAQTIAQVPLFSEAGGDIKVVKAKFFPVPVELKQEVDPVLREGLQKIADMLGVDVKVLQRVKSFRGALGVFIRQVDREVQDGAISEEERKWIELMFGTTERTKAHEVGHAIDSHYATMVDGKRVGGLIQALMASPQMKRELRSIADQRASDSASKSFRKYIRQREEQVADFVNRYVNANDQAKRLAPTVVKAFEAFIGQHPELKPLLTLRPSGRAEVMSIEGKTWTRSPFRPVPNALMVYRDGTPYWVQMPEDVFKACMGMTRGDVGVLVKIAAKPASWLRAGAVLSPEFISRNPLRDVVMAWVFSRHGFSFSEWFGDAYKLFTGDAEAKRLMAQFQGSGAAFADIATMFVETQAITVDKIMGKEKGIKYLSHPIEALREISSFMENTTRYSVYRQAMANGASHAAALHEARTVTLDFHRMGGNPYVRTLNMIIPFFNASLQGIDKLGSELLSGDKARAMQVLRKIMVGITLPSVLLWAMFGDDDRIKKLESWERNLFWHIPIPGGPILRFPKPFEVGIMFGSIPERVLDFARFKDAAGLKKALEQAFDALTPSPYPTIVRPFMEQYSNYNFFMGRKIEDAGMENLPVELRSKPWTSEAAKFFSRNFGKYVGISPVMFEQHVRNLFGGLGSNYAIPMIDFAMRKTGVAADIPKADEKWYNQTPFIRGLFSKEPSGFRSKTANDFFENYTKAFTTDQGWKTLWKHGQVEDAAQMVKDNPQAIFARVVRKEMSELGKIRKERDDILRNPKLDGAQKRVKLDEIDKRVDTILSVNQALMHPLVMEQVTAPVVGAIKKTAKTEKDVEKYYNLANQPIAKTFEKVSKEWKKYETMDVTERSNAIARLIKEQQRTFVPSSGGGSGQKKDSLTILGLPGTSKKELDIFGGTGKSSRKGLELFPSSTK